MPDVLLGENLNRAHRTFDKALELRNVADGAETATANETAISFEARKLKEYVAELFITACDGSSGDETYVFDISVSDLQAGTFTKVAQVPWTRGTTGKLTIPLSGDIAQQLDNDSDWIRVGCTLAGTTPSITYGAYLAPGFGGGR